MFGLSFCVTYICESINAAIVAYRHRLLSAHGNGTLLTLVTISFLVDWRTHSTSFLGMTLFRGICGV
jgi:hypothetical protein